MTAEQTIYFGPIRGETNGELEDGVYYMPSFFPFGKVGGLQIMRCQGLAVDDYGCALGAYTLEPSGFCNIGGEAYFKH